MSKSSLILKTRSANKLLNWIGNTFSGTMGTRHARVTWHIQDQKGLPTDDRRLKLQIKLPSKGPSFEALSSTLSLSTSPAQPEKPNLYTKTIFDENETKLMLLDVLNQLWDCSNNNNNDQTFSFVRTSPEIAREKLIVEYGSPNIAKPLHMGHLRSTVTGHYVARICRAAGHDVKTICFLGDWGTQFGILQAGLAKWLPKGEDVLSAVNKLELDELLNYYIRSVKEKEENTEFSTEALKCSSALEQGDPKAVQVWKSVREKTVDHLSSFWSLFDIHYDIIQGESEFTVQSTYTEKALKLLSELNVTEVADDNCISAVLQPDEKFSKIIKIPLVKKDGSSLYLLRDVACALARQDQFQFERMLYVVDKSQVHHFIALFRLLEILKLQVNKYHEDNWEKKLWHVTFGKVEGMSTRSGNFVLLSDVIRDGSAIMEENRAKSRNMRNSGDKNIATQLAISALVVNSLRVKRNKDVKFDWNEALRPTGETGVNLQYNHARLCSLEKKLSDTFDQKSITFDTDYILGDPLALELVIHLANFEDSFWSSYSELEPCVILAYLFRLSDKVSKALKNLKVQTEPNEQIAATRFLLFMLSKKILATGLHIIGLNPLEEI